MGKYADLGRDIGRLCESKREAYGASFDHTGSIMRVLYPNGISVEQYDDALVVVRIIDKLHRLANRKDAFGESPYRDISGYGILGAARDEEKNQPKPEPVKPEVP